MTPFVKGNWMSASPRFNFPFSAIVSQDRLKLALIISVIDPVLGGVLITGRKGTAKSTCARSLAEVLPTIEIVPGCDYGCNPKAPRKQLCTECINKKSKSSILKTETAPVPFVNLPLNATEDNITGGLDFRHAISTGRRRFRPGLLARAHRGIVYVDEINLLDDHLVNLLLDASTSGVNIVEREGISISHPSNFVLIGSMNPEEGGLRPQFLDRFGLCVNIETLFKPAERLQILKRRDYFENNPEAFLEKWSKKDELQKNNINGALSRLPFVKIREDFSCSISATALASHTAGHRADIVICRAARAIAAYRGRINVEAVDVRDAAQMALPHRVQKIKGIENNAGEATGVRFNAEGETVEFTDKKEGDKKKSGQNTNNQMHEKKSELDSFGRKKSGEETDIIEKGVSISLTL
ncbi:MAG: ATP-binding protein [Thermodesulfobacteriota bacterium]|nr:ATP-binding protein [Thermodesulfobacteriota bacterium]